MTVPANPPTDLALEETPGHYGNPEQAEIEAQADTYARTTISPEFADALLRLKADPRKPVVLQLSTPATRAEVDRLRRQAEEVADGTRKLAAEFARLQELTTQLVPVLAEFKQAFNFEEGDLPYATATLDMDVLEKLRVLAGVDEDGEFLDV